MTASPLWVYVCAPAACSWRVLAPPASTACLARAGPAPPPARASCPPNLGAPPGCLETLLQVQKVMTQPINLIFRFLQNKSRIVVWLFDQVHCRIEGRIIVRALQGAAHAPLAARPHRTGACALPRCCSRL